MRGRRPATFPPTATSRDASAAMQTRLIWRPPPSLGVPCALSCFGPDGRMPDQLPQSRASHRHATGRRRQPACRAPSPCGPSRMFCALKSCVPDRQGSRSVPNESAVAIVACTLSVAPPPVPGKPASVQADMGLRRRPSVRGVARRLARRWRMRPQAQPVDEPSLELVSAILACDGLARRKRAATGLVGPRPPPGLQLQFPASPAREPGTLGAARRCRETDD